MAPQRRAGVVCFAVAALVAASCSSSDGNTNTGDDGASPTTQGAADEIVDSTPVDSVQTDDTTAPATDPGDETDPSTDAATGTESDPADEGFAVLGAATGDPVVIGMVNTEGTPGLDFPEMRTDTDLAVAYLNEHGGFGGRPVVIEHCAAVGSPETSQACAQELSGKGVDLVMLGLDLFPGYDTFAASGIPVFGALPVLAGDYTADALFLTGGNATTMAAMVALAVEHFGASSVGIVSADNAGANASEAALTGALDKAGLTYVSIKGGDNETDAGFQGLIREANKDTPDLLVSLYSDAGCVGAMRGRASLGIATPVVTTAICASAEVIDVAGDDAVGWSFVGVGAPQDTAAAGAFQVIVEPVYGQAGSASLGLGALGITQVMTLARVANSIAADGNAVTGQALFDALRTTSVRTFPNDNAVSCGLAAAYPSICAFEFPIGEYVAGGEIRTIPGFEGFSVVDYLP